MKRVLLFFLCFSIAWAQPEVETEVLQTGLGEPITTGETATLAYKLVLPDDTLVDQASFRDPYTFKVGSSKVVKGLSAGVRGMKVGEKRKITVPPELGYGAQDKGVIPANSTLIFEVELLQITEPVVQTQAEKFQDEEFLRDRDANLIDKPAMFEYLIRDFFTKPWRYQDGHLKVWNSSAKVAGAIMLLLILIFVAHKSRRIIL